MSAGNFEIPVGLDRNPSHVGADLRPFGDHRAHHVAGLETVHLARPFGTAAWEPQFVHIAQLPALSPFRRDEQGDDLLKVDLLRRGRSHAYRVQPVRFGHATLCSIPFRPASCTYFQRQSRGF